MGVGLAGVLLLLPISEAPKGSVYRLDAAADLLSTLSVSTVTMLIDQEKNGWTPAAACTVDDEAGVCNRELLSIIDRWNVDYIDPDAAQLSDALLVSMIGAGLMYSAGEAAFGNFEEPGLRFVEDSVVLVESVVFTQLATAVLKIAVRRPRPYSYNPKVNKDERFVWDVRLSFPSGHTSVSFATATTIALTVFQRRGGALALGVSTLAYGTAALVGYLRLASGRHFLTDVLAGAALGTAVGIGIVLFHHRSEDDTLPGSTAPALQQKPIFSLGGTF